MSMFTVLDCMSLVLVLRVQYEYSYYAYSTLVCKFGFVNL